MLGIHLLRFYFGRNALWDGEANATSVERLRDGKRNADSHNVLTCKSPLGAEEHMLPLI